MSANRREFKQTTRKAALKRAAGRCEGYGEIFGLGTNRCGGALAHGVYFEHVDPDYNSKDNSLENCAAVCPRCWRFKTDTYDKPLVAKTKRMAAKDCGLKRPKGTWGAGRNTPYKQKIGGRTVLR